MNMTGRVAGPAGAGSDTFDLVERHPPALARRALERIDGPLDDGALREVALIVRSAAEDLVGKVPDQVGVEEERPWLPDPAPGWGVAPREIPFHQPHRLL